MAAILQETLSAWRGASGRLVEWHSDGSLPVAIQSQGVEGWQVCFHLKDSSKQQEEPDGEFRWGSSNHIVY